MILFRLFLSFSLFAMFVMPSQCDATEAFTTKEGQEDRTFPVNVELDPKKRTVGDVCGHLLRAQNMIGMAWTAEKIDEAVQLLVKFVQATTDHNYLFDAAHELYYAGGDYARLYAVAIYEALARKLTPVMRGRAKRYLEEIADQKRESVRVAKAAEKALREIWEEEPSQCKWLKLNEAQRRTEETVGVLQGG